MKTKLMSLSVWVVAVLALFIIVGCRMLTVG
jgi:hypothetical protein